MDDSAPAGDGFDLIKVIEVGTKSHMSVRADKVQRHHATHKGGNPKLRTVLACGCCASWLEAAVGSGRSRHHAGTTAGFKRYWHGEDAQLRKDEGDYPNPHRGAKC